MVTRVSPCGSFSVLPQIRSVQKVFQYLDQTSCTQLLEKVKKVFWKGTSSPAVIRPLVNEGRSFVQKYSANCKIKPVVELERYVNALALRVLPDFPHYHLKRAEPRAEFGLTQRLAAKNPDLADFTRQHRIRSAREVFGHTVFQEKDGQPLVHFEGNQVQWNIAKKKIFGSEHPKSMALPHGWKYIDKGIVHQHLVNWTKLEPTGKDHMPSQKGKFYLELVSKKRSYVGELNHSFFRLIDDEGNLISVGLGATTNNWLPFRTLKGKLRSPDHAEFEDGIEYSVRFPLDQKLYDKVKTRLESDQNNNELFFNIITRNCAAYSAEILKEIGIEIDVKEYPTEMLWRSLGLAKMPLPNSCKKVLLFVFNLLNYLISPLLNFLVFVLGAAYTDPGMKELQKAKGKEWMQKWKKPFSSIKTLFDGTNFYIDTGWKLREWQKTQPSYKERIHPKTPWNKR